MANWRLIKRLASADGERRIDVEQGTHGMFRYVEEVYEIADPIEAPEKYWLPYGESGLFGSAEAAEQDARQATPWLRDAGDEI